MVDITDTWTEQELTLYQTLIGKNLVDMVMTAHDLAPTRIDQSAERIQKLKEKFNLAPRIL